jgi:hypothetical protein
VRNFKKISAIMRNRIGSSYNKKKVRDYSYKLSCAVEILKYEYGNVTTIRTLINQNSDLDLLDSEFSKLLGSARPQTAGIEGGLGRVFMGSNDHRRY